MKVKDTLTINSIDDFRITLFQLFYGNDDEIFVDVDGKFKTIKLNEIYSFKDIFNLGENVFLTPKIETNWGVKTIDYKDYKDLEVFEKNDTFLKNIKHKPKWVHTKNHNLRFLLEIIIPEKYLKPIFGKK